MARTSELLSSCWTSAGAVVPVLCGDVSAFTVEKRVAAVAKARDREIGISAPDLVVARDTRLSGAGQTARRECGVGPDGHDAQDGEKRGTTANEMVLMRYPGNPIVTASAVPRVNSTHNSAIVKRADGDYAGVFRVDEISMRFTLHVGFSRDGIAWEIEPDPLVRQGNDAEVLVTDQSYDPRLTRIDDTYYLS